MATSDNFEERTVSVPTSGGATGGSGQVASVTADASAVDNFQRNPTEEELINQAREENQASNEDYSPTEKDVQDYIDRQGPLGSLYENQYKPKSLAYPRDLGRIGKGHTVQFDIRNIKPATADLEAIGTTANKAASDAYNSYKNKNNNNSPSEIREGLVAAGQSIWEVVNAQNRVVNFANVVKSDATKLIQESYTNELSTIRLYMPDSLSFDYNAQYDKLSLADALSAVPLVGWIPTAIMSMLNNKALKYAGGKLGYTFNPQQQMLFEGIEFREFQMQFVFTPTSKKEADNVRRIIKMFRTAAAPTRNTGAAGFFFTPPSVFNISFFFEGAYNKYITPIRPCVLQNLSVDFAPNGWSAMRDGSPMQTSLTLSFKEIELVDRESIKGEWE